MKKQLTAALAALCLTLTLLPVSVLAADHRFVPTGQDPEDDWFCSHCGSYITVDLKKGYDAVLTLDGKTLPGDLERTEQAALRYVEQLAQRTLDEAGWYVGTVAEIGCTAPAAGRSGELRYTVTVQSYGRSSLLLADVTTPVMTLVIPALAESTGSASDPNRTGESGLGGNSVSQPGVSPSNQSNNWLDTTWWNLSNGQWANQSPGDRRDQTMGMVLWYAWISQYNRPLIFTDVPQDSWYRSAVEYVWSNCLMSGVSATEFAPDSLASRGMVWTVLARMKGASVGPIGGEAWYVSGTEWAIRCGLADGSDPEGMVTREYLAEMLWVCSGSPLASADLSGYRDHTQVSPYAVNAVRWAVSNGILQGSGGQLSPQGSVTRAELAAMVMRCRQLA